MHIEKLVIETLKIKDHTIISCTSEGNLIIKLDARRKRLLPCSHCGMRSHRHDRLAERIWDHVPVWGIPVFLVYRPWRVRCSHCGIKREALPWAEGKSRLTRALVVTLATWAKLLPVETVASLFGVSWNTVYAAVRAAVSFGLAHRTPGIITHIGIDEISRKKGHRYLTQVYDLDTRTLIWSGEGRKESTLRAFFQQYPDVAQTVRAVCCDMWQPYVTVVREYCPDAELVFDKFHIIRHLLDAVDQVRREEAYEIRKVDPEVLKKTRYVILKNEENLTEKQHLRLKDLEKRKLKSVRAWLLKESFRTFWASPNPAVARAFLDQWCWMAMHSRLEPIKKVVKLIRNHADGILAFFKHGITNGVVEALNNTAKAISHRARGYRTVDAFSKIMLLCMGGLDLPTLHHEFV